MQAGASEDKVRDVESAEKSALYTESERAAIAYAEAMTITGQRVTDALFARVRAHFDEPQVVELTAAVALAIAEQVFGREHAAIAKLVNTLAVLHELQGHYAEADVLQRRALAIREKALGAEHREVATSLNNLAELCRVRARYAEAEPLYRR